MTHAKKKLYLFLVLVLVINNTHADQNSFLVAHLIVPYISTTNTMAFLKKTSCGHTVNNKNYDVNQVRQSILNSLNQIDRENATMFFKSKKYEILLKESEDVVTDILIFSDKKGLDEKTFCGIIVDIFDSAQFKAEIDWIKAMSKY